MWSYYRKYQDQGQISLNELLEALASGYFSFDTWVKPQQGLYWTPIKECPELLLHLNWDYITKNTIDTASGKDLLILFRARLISANTQVKIATQYDWQKFNTTPLWEVTSRRILSPAFYGYSSVRPCIRNHIANAIDTIMFVIFMIYGASFPYGIFAFMHRHFSQEPSTKNAMLGFGMNYIATFFLLLLLCVCFFSFLEAIFLCTFGGTLGSKMAGLYILTSKGKRLTFFQALRRQFFLRIESPSIIKRWDQKHSVITTNLCK